MSQKDRSQHDRGLWKAALEAERRLARAGKWVERTGRTHAANRQARKAQRMAARWAAFAQSSSVL